MSEPRPPFEIPAHLRFHGAYLAEVISLDDPENLARVQVQLHGFR